MIISHLSCSFSCCSAIAKLQSLSLHDALPIYSEVQSQHVASSVSTIDIERVRSGPVAKLQEVFKGTLPGVNLMQGSNLPGQVPGNIQIRGISTLPGSAPLVSGGRKSRRLNSRHGDSSLA